MSTDYIIRRHPESFIRVPAHPETPVKYSYEATPHTVMRTNANGETYGVALERVDLERTVRKYPDKWEVVYDGDVKDEQQDRRVTLHVTEVIMLDGEVISRDDLITLYNEIRQVLKET